MKALLLAVALAATYEGRVYAFCCPDCKPDFDKDPAKYAKGSVR